MTMTLTQIEKEALKLPAEQQMRLAQDLWQHRGLTEIEQEHLRAVRERIKQADSGQSKFVDADIVVKTLLAKYDS